MYCYLVLRNGFYTSRRCYERVPQQCVYLIKGPVYIKAILSYVLTSYN